MTIPLTPEEQAIAAEMRRVCGLRSNLDLVKVALWWYARFLDLDPPANAFALAAFARAHRGAKREPDEVDGETEDQDGFLG